MKHRKITIVPAGGVIHLSATVTDKTNTPVGGVFKEIECVIEREDKTVLFAKLTTGLVKTIEKEPGVYYCDYKPPRPGLYRAQWYTDERVIRLPVFKFRVVEED